MSGLSGGSGGVAQPSSLSLRTGVDLLEIARLHRAVSLYGERFLRRVYTPTELEQCRRRLESLAARFAAKEAVSKALGTGIWRAGIGWTDIEVVKDADSGAPQLYLYRAAADRAAALGICSWSVSLSHDRERAIAFVAALTG